VPADDDLMKKSSRNQKTYTLCTSLTVPSVAVCPTVTCPLSFFPCVTLFCHQ